MVPEINYWAVVIAMVSTMVVGTVWYTPKVFGNRWMQLANVDMDKQGSAVVPIIVTVVVSFITAWVLAGASAIAWHFYGEGNFLVTTLITGIMLWAGFTAARFITHDAFEGRPPALTLMNVSHELVTVVVMALIIGVWPPAFS